MALAALLSISPLRGQTVWNGNTNSQWSTADNWSAGVPNSNASTARFIDGPANRDVTVDGTFTFKSLEFQGGKQSLPYTFSGGTLIYDRNGNGGSGIADISTHDNMINSAIEVRNSGSTGSPSIFEKSATAGTLILAGQITTSTNTLFDARKGGNIVITGNIVGAEDANPGQFNLSFQVLEESSVTIEGPGSSSNPSGGTVCISLGSESSAGRLNLNRPASLAGGMILFINAAGVSISALNLGADHAIANEEGVFRTQVLKDGQSVNLNTNGHKLDLGNKMLLLFPWGSPMATFNIDLGAGNSSVCFAASSSKKWKGALAITNFTKGKDSVRFGTDASGLQPEQLALISINGASGTSIDSKGFLIPGQL